MADSVNISDPHQVPVTFVNDVVGRGILNGVCNLTFAVARWTPTPEQTVDPDIIIASRLRMDLYCARQLYNALGALLERSNGTTKPN